MIPGLGGSLGEGHGNPLWYSCLENPMDRGARWATVHGVARVGNDLATKPPAMKKRKMECHESLSPVNRTSLNDYTFVLMCVCSVAQSCLTLCDPIDYSLPGSSVQGIFQARLLEWVAISYSKRSS